MAVTWNPSDKDASITLSAGNLTATKNAVTTWAAARATAPLGAGGKWYWEVSIVPKPGAGSNTVGLGIANASAVLNDYIGVNSNGGAGYNFNGNFVINQALIGTGGTSGGNNVVRVAVDLANSRIWLAVAGGNWNNSGAANPATNTGGFSLATLAAGPYYPTISLYDTGAGTANFGASALTYLPPSGFTAVDPIVLAATPLAVASPPIGAPAMSQVHALSPTALAVGGPVLGSPIFNTHLAATGLAVGSPAIGAIRLNPWLGLPVTAETWTPLAP